MPHIKQFHQPKLSIWQSAVDEVVADRKAAQTAAAAPATSAPGSATASPAKPAGGGPRPDLSHPMIREAADYCAAQPAAAQAVQTPATLTAPQGTEGAVCFC
ncbi:MAG: hypothetical protein ACRD2O_03215 [Terriglobia bacterium]